MHAVGKTFPAISQWKLQNVPVTDIDFLRVQLLVICKLLVSIETKLRVLRTCVFLIATYACEHMDTRKNSLIVIVAQSN